MKRFFCDDGGVPQTFVISQSVANLNDVLAGLQFLCERNNATLARSPTNQIYTKLQMERLTLTCANTRDPPESQPRRTQFTLALFVEIRSLSHPSTHERHERKFFRQATDRRSPPTSSGQGLRRQRTSKSFIEHEDNSEFPIRLWDVTSTPSPW